MNGKAIIQILMVFLIILISLSFYLKYFKKSSKKLENDTNIEKVDIEENTSSTYINDVNYVSSDAKGNKYQITAEQAEIDINDSDTMFLRNIIAYISIKDTDTIKVTSDFGKYNAKNYDTIFSKNVIIVYPGHKITGEYLDFSFLNNLGVISNNVIYSGDNVSLFADRIEIDLITRDTKIFMDDTDILDDFHDPKKVFIEGIK
jgi:LPS export ABC transporter protein LptC